MFGRIKRFFIALRVLRKRAKEERAIRKELNLNSMGYLVRTLAPRPRRNAKIDTMVFKLLPGQEGCPQQVTQEDVEKVLEESKVDNITSVHRTTRHDFDAEKRLKDHEKKFRG